MPLFSPAPVGEEMPDWLRFSLSSSEGRSSAHGRRHPSPGWGRGKERPASSGCRLQQGAAEGLLLAGSLLLHGGCAPHGRSQFATMSCKQRVAARHPSQARSLCLATSPTPGAPTAGAGRFDRLLLQLSKDSPRRSSMLPCHPLPSLPW
jgi:hypothetical protein